MLLVAELLPEISDVDLDVIGVAVKVIAPDLVEDAVAGQHLVGMHHQQPKEIELARGQVDLAPVPANVAGGLVHGDVLHLQLWAGVRIPAAHDCPDPSQQLPEIERFDQVVVRPHLEPLDPVLDLVACRENDDPGVLVAADRLGHRQAVQLRHHDVEHHDVRLELADQPQGGLAVGRRLHLEAFVLKAQPNEVDDAALVVHDEDARAAGGRCVRGGLRHFGLNITAVFAKSQLPEPFSAGSQ